MLVFYLQNNGYFSKADLYPDFLIYNIYMEVDLLLNYFVKVKLIWICLNTQVDLIKLLQVDGIQGIMSAYISALRNVSLAGPTLFGHLISTAMAIASQSLADNQQKYFILLIVTVCIPLKPSLKKCCL